MAQDYHIYLHGDSSGSSSGGNQTKPFSVSKATTTGSGAAFATKVQKAYSVGSTAASGSVASTGAAALMKVVPWLAVIYIAWKVTDKVLSTGFAHQAEYTANYENNVNYNNFKTIAGYVLNPLSLAKVTIHSRKQYEKQNKEIAQQNRLLGDSVLKDFNIGV